MSDWEYPCVLDSGERIVLLSGRDYYWKRSDGFQWDGRERWWEFYVEIHPGMNGGGGVWIHEKSRWNGAFNWQFNTPRNLSHEETRDMFRAIVANLSNGPTGQIVQPVPAKATLGRPETGGAVGASDNQTGDK
jgi:hypothetical protein